MAHRAKTKTVPADTVYRSLPRQQQKTFPSRRRKVARRISTPRPLSRQQTLTQIDGGVSFVGSADSAEDEEWEEPRPRKRRRTRLSESKRQATLTQIGYVSTIPPSDEEDLSIYEEEECPDGEDGTTTASDDDEGQAQDDSVGTSESDGNEMQLEDGDGGLQGNEWEGVQIEHKHTIKEEDTQDDTLADVPEDAPIQSPSTISARKGSLPKSNLRNRPAPPQTPKRVWKLEIPSSQSPAVTPLSTIRTQRTMDPRSPLEPPLPNAQQLLDTPSKLRRSTSNAITPNSPNGRRQLVTEKGQLGSVARADAQLRRKKSFIQDSLDGSEYEYSETEDEDESITKGSNIDIGQETQAMICKIDEACAEHSPDMGVEEADAGLSHSESSAVRSFEFDIDDSAALHEGPGHESDRVEESQLRSSPPPLDTSSAPGQVSRSPLSSSKSVEDNSDEEHTLKVIRSDRRNQTRRSHSQKTSKTRHPKSTREQAHPQSRFNTRQGWPELGYSSQATTVASTPQNSISRTQRHHPHSPSQTPSKQQPSSSPFPMAPLGSSSIPPEQPRWGARHLQLGGDRVVTASQLLPDSLMDLSLPPPPPWTQDEGTES